MAGEIKDLIEQINREGIEKAQDAAREIEIEAKRKAFEIVEKAKKEAASLLSQAQEKILCMEEKEKTLLAQAGRDLMLSLRKQINQMLEKLVLLEVGQRLTPEGMYKIILELVKDVSCKDQSSIIVFLKEEDRIALEREFLGRLKQETQKLITLKVSNEISAGFSISFDAGKTQFDFTDHSLAEYIGLGLNPRLKEILKEAVSKT